MVTANKREGEPASALIFRFTKKVRRSGAIMETRKRRFSDRPVSRRKRRASAIFKADKKKELERQKKFGLI
jgi:ribosomal protein S21